MLDYNNKINSEMSLITEFKNRNLTISAGSFMFALQYECYYTAMANRSGEKLARDFTSDIHSAELRFVKFYNENKHLTDVLSAEVKGKLYSGMVNRFFTKYNRSTNPTLTFEDWIAELNKEII